MNPARPLARAQLHHTPPQDSASVRTWPIKPMRNPATGPNRQANTAHRAEAAWKRETYLENEESSVCHGRDVAFCAASVARQLPYVTLGEAYPVGEIVLQ